MNISIPAITPAVCTVLSAGFSGSTVLVFCVEAPLRERKGRSCLSLLFKKGLKCPRRYTKLSLAVKRLKWFIRKYKWELQMVAWSMWAN